MRIAAAKPATFVAMSLAAAWTLPALADPPAHAPAHGWRRHHERDHDRDHDRDRDRDEDARYYVGYGGEHWEHDYDILSGRCNREAVATVVGGVVGGVVAAHVSEPENRTVATIIGAAAGALIGKKIGHELDEADRGCFGHALEIGESGRRVVWTNASTGVRYEMVPGAASRRDGAPCRAFTLLAVAGDRRSTRVGLACRSQPGLWEVVG